MTQQEINEYNKRCAEFLGILYGLRQNGIVKEESKVRIRGILDLEETKGLHINHCKFHSDWNWIHEVIDALEELGSYTIMGIKQKGAFKIEGDKVEFYFNPNQQLLLHLQVRPFIHEYTWKHPMYKNHITSSCKGKTKKEAVVQAIDEFLIWYEQSKTT